MQSASKTVTEYIDSLPADRKVTVSKLRDLILANLPEGYKEGMDYGMISYFIPLEVYPSTYNKHPLTYIALASQKNYLSLYMLGLYTSDEEEKAFRKEYEATGKKLNMGRSCIRFKKLDDLALDVIAKRIASVSPEKFIQLYEQARKK